jgi:cell division protein FtsQ
MSDRRTGSFSAYNEGHETPIDFAPIRAESRHAVRPEGKAIDAESDKAPRRLRGWLVLILLVGLSGIAANQFRGEISDSIAVLAQQLPVVDLPDFDRPVINKPINTVRLESPLNRVTEQEVRMLLARYTESGFLGMDVQDLRDELELNPWVERATVRRVWPDELVIMIDEQRPIARWREGSLLNEHGEVFSPPMRGSETELPLFSGPEGSESLVRANFEHFNTLLSAIDMRLHTISVDARGSWSGVVADGPVLRIGREDVEERMTRFVRLIKGGLAEQLANAETIDLRYNNGISVSNKTDVTGSVASR